MIKNITMGQYIPGNSILHRADPRTKIVWTILLLIALFTANNIYGYVMMLAIVGIILAVSEIRVSYTLRGIKPLLVILIITSLINIFTYPGNTVLFSAGVFKITLEGIFEAIIVAVRLSLMVIIGSVLTLTTTPIALTDGLEKLMRPLKKIRVPVHEMAMMMSIALRFIPTLLEETDRIIKAQSSRGADFDTGNFIEKAKSFVPVLIPLFVSAFKRAEELATAMEARCYRGDAGRTRMKELVFTKVDRNINLFLTAFFIVFIISAFVL